MQEPSPATGSGEDVLAAGAEPVTDLLDGLHTMVLEAPRFVLDPGRCLAEVAFQPSRWGTRRMRLAAVRGSLRMPVLGTAGSLEVEFSHAQAEPRLWSRRPATRPAADDPHLVLSCSDLVRTRRDLVGVRGELVLGDHPPRGFRGALRVVESSDQHQLVSVVGEAEAVSERPPDAPPGLLADVLFGRGTQLELAMELTR